MTGTARTACRRLAVLAAAAALFATGQATAHAAWAPDHHHNGFCGWANPASGCDPYGKNSCFGACSGFGSWDDDREHKYEHDYDHRHDHSDHHHDSGWGYQPLFF